MGDLKTRENIRNEIKDTISLLEETAKHIMRRIISNDGAWYSSRNEDDHDYQVVRAAIEVLKL